MAHSICGEIQFRKFHEKIWWYDSVGDDLGNDTMKGAVGDPHGGGMIIISRDRRNIGPCTLDPMAFAKSGLSGLQLGRFLPLGSDKVRQGP